MTFQELAFRLDTLGAQLRVSSYGGVVTAMLFVGKQLVVLATDSKLEDAVRRALEAAELRAEVMYMGLMRGPEEKRGLN